MNGCTRRSTVVYPLDCRLDHPAAIDHHNRKYDGDVYELDRVGRDATDRFAWCKPKLSEFRQWRTNPMPRPLANVPTSALVAALEPFHERMAARLSGRTISKPAAECGQSRGRPLVDSPMMAGATPAAAFTRAAAGEETVSDASAELFADALLGPPLDSHVSRAYRDPDARLDTVHVTVHRLLKRGEIAALGTHGSYRYVPRERGDE